MQTFIISHLKSILLFILISALVALGLTYIAIQPAPFLSWDYTKTGSIGDTIGGIAGTIVALIAAIMALCAFWAQYEANESLAKSNELQKIKSSISEHISLLSTVRLYDRENGGAGYQFKDSQNHNTYSASCKETLLREGAEAFFALYQKFFIQTFIRPSQYEQKDNKYETVVDAYLRFIWERGYLFSYCLNHALVILQDIDNSIHLSSNEKETFVREYISMLPTYELVLLMLRFKLDEKVLSNKEIEIVVKYSIFADLFPIIDPSHDPYTADFNRYIKSLSYLKKQT